MKPKARTLAAVGCIILGGMSCSNSEPGLETRRSIHDSSKPDGNNGTDEPGEPVAKMPSILQYADSGEADETSTNSLPVGPDSVPDRVLSVDEFYAEKEALEDQYKNAARSPAADRYDGKVVRLVGNVEYLYTGKGKVSLGSSDGSLIHCELYDQHPWKTIGLGQTVTLIGRGEMTTWHLRLLDCAILHVEGDPPARFTVDRLIKAVQTLRRFTPVIVSGTVKERRQTEFGDNVILEGIEEIEIHCHFSGNRKSLEKYLRAKRGDEVEISGYVVDQDVPDAVSLHWCIAVAKNDGE